MRQTKISVKHLQAAAKLYRVSRFYMQYKINTNPHYVDPLLDDVLEAVVDYEVAVNESWNTMEDYAIHEGFRDTEKKYKDPNLDNAGEPIDGDIYVEGLD